MSQILIPISPGDLLDKITILEIKFERIESAEKKSNVKEELKLLIKAWGDSEIGDTDLTTMRRQLKSINKVLWDIEDNIRREEHNKNFGNRFIELARSVYMKNDERAKIKKRINTHLNSEIVEEKSYQSYS